MGRSHRVVMSFLILLIAVATASQAEIPQMISYQGKVTDASGNPVADGSYTMRFRIYDQFIGGTPLWDSGAQGVDVAGGVFSVVLGGTGYPTLGLDFDTDYWLLVTFAGVDQTPRQRVTSAGYAYMASGLVAGTEVSGAVTAGTLAAIKGSNTATSGEGYGVVGQSPSPEGAGVYGLATASTGSAYGLYGESASTAGRGVYGNASSTSGLTYGGYFESGSIFGFGVYAIAPYAGVEGCATATSGTICGGYFQSKSTAGRGVEGCASASSGITYGVYGNSYSPSGRGVVGFVSNALGVTYGGYFESRSMGGTGVYGWSTATSGATYGVHGVSASTGGYGVYGNASATSGLTYGGHFESESPEGTGVYGYVYATEGQTEGVYGVTESTEGRGVVGWAKATTGVTRGVYGRSDSPDGYGVYYHGGINGTGLMRAVVRTSRGPTALDAMTAAGSWVEDFGEGHLVSGRCHIELDPLFLETVTIDDANPMKVFVEHRGPCGGTYVLTGETGFDVVEQESGTSTCAFMYRVVAKRKGFEEKRLDVCEAARTDSYLYPELREKSESEASGERLEE